MTFSRLKWTSIRMNNSMLSKPTREHKLMKKLVLRFTSPSMLNSVVERNASASQSKTYPTKSIAIEYLRGEKGITGVIHMPNIGGCGKGEKQ